tara:strand:- start:8347 stop:9438 length:1092 start_codon:yes stop_codon:yes gene_type:complete
MSFNEPLNQDLKDKNLIYKEEPSKLPYEDPPDTIDVDVLQQGEVNRVMRRYAVLSSVAYNLYNTDYNRASKNMQELLPLHEIDPDLSDGYSSVIIKKHTDKPDDIIISYRGTQNLTDLAVDATQIATGSPLEKLAGINTGYFRLAQDKYNLVKDKYPDSNITTTGHSLGGSQAYYIGKTNNIPSYIFNAGSSPLDILTDYGLTHTNFNRSTHYHVSGDIVSASKALLGSDKDTLVKVNQQKWIKDLLGTMGAISFGGAVGNVPGATLAAAASGYSLFNDLHGLHNFMPPESFKETLDPEDIMYSWIKPIYNTLEQESRFSKRTQITDFKKPINKKEFLKFCFNPYDPKCRNYSSMRVSVKPRM